LPSSVRWFDFHDAPIENTAMERLANGAPASGGSAFVAGAAFSWPNKVNFQNQQSAMQSFDSERGKCGAPTIRNPQFAIRNCSAAIRNSQLFMVESPIVSEKGGDFHWPRLLFRKVNLWKAL
jgi:hypothetical protein